MTKEELIDKVINSMRDEILNGYYQTLIVIMIRASLSDWKVEDIKTLLRKNKEWKKRNK